MFFFCNYTSGGPRIVVRGAKIFIRNFAHGVKWSSTNEVSFNRPESRAYLSALEAIGILFIEYGFSLFSGYLSVLFLK